MKYNFDELTERRGTSCVKWDESPSADVIPMWVADMDFAVAPAIQEAIRKRAIPMFKKTITQPLSHGSCAAMDGESNGRRSSTLPVSFPPCHVLSRL